MKKGVVLVFVILILFVKMASADYVCDNKGPIVEDTEEIDLGESKYVNFLSLGLAGSDEIVALKRITVELIVDSRSINLRNSTTVSGEFEDGTDYSATLINSTENDATIRVNGETKLLEEKDILVVGGFYVSLFKSAGDFTAGNPNVDILVGPKLIDLASNSNISKLVSINNTDYLVDLTSASDNNTIISVKRCENETEKIVDESSLSEETTLNENNETGTQNTSTNETADGAGNVGEVQEENKQGPSMVLIIGYIAGGFLVLIIASTLFVQYRRNRLDKETGIWKQESEEQNEPEGEAEG